MWKVTISGLLAHKLRLALTALAIVLGVTFISGTLVLTDTLHSTFTTLFGHIYQNIDFEVRGKTALRSYRRLRDAANVAGLDKSRRRGSRRNETPNNKDTNIYDTIRNTIIALTARAGLSGPQWKLLVKGLLNDL